LKNGSSEIIVVVNHNLVIYASRINIFSFFLI
jgi:hypothetical protein